MPSETKKPSHDVPKHGGTMEERAASSDMYTSMCKSVLSPPLTITVHTVDSDCNGMEMTIYGMEMTIWSTAPAGVFYASPRAELGEPLLAVFVANLYCNVLSVREHNPTVISFGKEISHSVPSSKLCVEDFHHPSIREDETAQHGRSASGQKVHEKRLPLMLALSAHQSVGPHPLQFDYQDSGPVPSKGIASSFHTSVPWRNPLRHVLNYKVTSRHLVAMCMNTNGQKERKKERKNKIKTERKKHEPC